MVATDAVPGAALCGVVMSMIERELGRIIQSAAADQWLKVASGPTQAPPPSIDPPSTSSGARPRTPRRIGDAGAQCGAGPQSLLPSNPAPGAAPVPPPRTARQPTSPTSDHLREAAKTRHEQGFSRSRRALAESGGWRRTCGALNVTFVCRLGCRGAYGPGVRSTAASAVAASASRIAAPSSAFESART